jgi:hypothetical protein
MDSTTISKLSDADLDATYADAFAFKDTKAIQLLNSEIISRLATPVGFFEGLIGYSKFPLYDKIGKGFNQVDAAQGSVVDSAGAAISQAGSMIKSVDGFVSGIANKGIAIAVGLGLAWIYFNRRK